MMFLVRSQIQQWKNQCGFSVSTMLSGHRFYKHSVSRRKCVSKSTKSLVSCSYSIEKNDTLPSLKQLSDARVIYAAAPALGHNKEAHPESSARVPAIVTALEQMELTSKFRGSDVLELQIFNLASVDDVANVHAKAYVYGLEKAMDQASEQGLIVIDGSGPTYATSTTFHESLVAAGAGLALVDSVVMSQPRTPPGHHAIPEGSMGFCVFGNVVIAARYAQHVHGLKRVFIIDFDVHHGWKLPWHRKIDQIGKRAGEGATLNLPLPGGSGDTAMRTVFDEVIVPCAQRFKPDIILVSAGYDGHVLDPLANLQFTTATYYMLASNIKHLAKDLCGGRCVFFLEGGFNLKSLSYSVADSFQTFLGEPSLAG
ncbi:Histone deacetylase 14 [Hibiscus syriacus]|uniref:Histone deacetylase 14 n=1 Tax=Hibiscus syriacus TaxID=106335 RepID=A0A6A3AQA7_HIBSY|nr:Histone deacetylase 14 [Hibiscus syriacus]